MPSAWAESLKSACSGLAMMAPTVRKAWLSATPAHSASTMAHAARGVSRALAGPLSGTVALLVFLATAAGAGVVAAGRGFLEHGLDLRAQALPELAQVVHGPDGGAEIVQPLLAHARRAVVAEHRERGLGL